MVKYMENIYKSNYIELTEYSNVGSYFQTMIEESDFDVIVTRQNPAWYGVIEGYMWLYISINRYGNNEMELKVAF